ncbi:MAG TPA: winged helix-turn-helix domain-containing protein [Candidatus Limnocylindrales bacterium]|nr:winged helix-turn-helix domain-containing protein [Candidatus Limnocylindrales bacterium]
MRLENRYNLNSHIENKLRPPHSPDVRKYTIFDFRQVGSKEKQPFVNLLPGKVTFWPEDHSVIVQGDKRSLRPKEQALLRQLLEQPNCIISSEELSGKIWPNRPYRPTQLPLLALQLRRKIEPTPKKPVIIQTVKGEGYRFGDKRETRTEVEIKIAKDIVYLPDQRKIVVNGKEKKLSKPQDAFLEMLIEKNHESVSGEEIYDHAWPSEQYSLVRLSTLVRSLREKLEPDPLKPTIILRVRGEGYKLADLDSSKEKELELAVGKLRYSHGQRNITLGKDVVVLTEREHSVLLAFCASPGEIMTRDELKRRAWGDDSNVQIVNVNNYVTKIRNKLGKDSIRKHFGIGYSLNLAEGFDNK